MPEDKHVLMLFGHLTISSSAASASESAATSC